MPWQDDMQAVSGAIAQQRRPAREPLADPVQLGIAAGSLRALRNDAELTAATEQMGPEQLDQFEEAYKEQVKQTLADEITKAVRRIGLAIRDDAEAAEFKAELVGIVESIMGGETE